MDDTDKLRKLTDEIDLMLIKQIDPSSEEFITWKTKTERVLGRIYGEGSTETTGFKNTMFLALSASTYSDFIETCHGALKDTRARFRVYVEELDEKRDTEQGDSAGLQSKTMTNNSAKDYTKVFIVHGHDGELKASVARLIEKQGIEAIILSEQSSRGMTVIEKFESYADKAGAAICLFTADDTMSDDTKRARQNVVFEAGYFYGKIGRKHTIVIADEETMNLSDLRGIVYVNRGNWELDLLKELRDIGYQIDLNKL